MKYKKVEGWEVLSEKKNQSVSKKQFKTLIDMVEEIWGKPLPEYLTTTPEYIGSPDWGKDIDLEKFMKPSYGIPKGKLISIGGPVLGYYKCPCCELLFYPEKDRRLPAHRIYNIHTGKYKDCPGSGHLISEKSHAT